MVSRGVLQRGERGAHGVAARRHVIHEMNLAMALSSGVLGRLRLSVFGRSTDAALS